MPLLNNDSTPGTTIAENNFALMISDDPTIANMFQSVEITINKFSLNHATNGWQELIPETKIIDLTDIKGALAQKIWEGILPVGQYTAVRVELSSVSATLKPEYTGATFSITPPDAIALEVAIGFEITADSQVDYVYDLTVDGSIGDFGLAPVEVESGPDTPFQLIQAP